MSPLDDAIIAATERVAGTEEPAQNQADPIACSSEGQPERPSSDSGGAPLETEWIRGLDALRPTRGDGYLRREVGKEDTMPDGSQTAGLSTSQREQLHVLLAKVEAGLRDYEALRFSIRCELDGVPGLPVSIADLSADVALLASPDAPLVLGEGEPPLDEIACAAAEGALPDDYARDAIRDEERPWTEEDEAAHAETTAQLRNDLEMRR